jgi:shikimate 5-dehydrogenase
MLTHQGAASFELWTGKRAPIDVMKAAVRKELREGRK